jgi:hypothetical protein
MDQLLPIFTQWLDSSLVTILGICLMAYLVIGTLMSLHMASFYYMAKHPADLPMEIKVPRDVAIGTGIVMIISCSSLDLALLLRDASLFTVIVALAIDMVFLFVCTGPVFFSLRSYRFYRKEAEKSYELQEKRGDQDGPSV